MITGPATPALGSHSSGARAELSQCDFAHLIGSKSKPLSVVREYYQDTLEPVKWADLEVTQSVTFGSVRLCLKTVHPVEVCRSAFRHLERAAQPVSKIR